MLEQLEQLFLNFKQALPTLGSSADVLNLKAEYLGKKGSIAQVLKSLKDASPDQRKVLGGRANAVKDEIQTLIVTRLSDLEQEEINRKLASQRIDITLRDSVMAASTNSGGVHPVTLIWHEIEDLFLSMGFEILDGPHVEDEHHNFEALNIPADHPARDMQDTFWFHNPHDQSVDHRHLLRTHTSTVQVRGMSERTPPFRFIAPGKVFRAERTDASHEMVFHQVEGMMVGKDISVSHLIYFMKSILKEIFKREVTIRLRPGFFPFVEPGFELDIHCLICDGKGCSVCKQVGWVELLPCGMVHPNVLTAGGIDPNQYNGYAFGLGLDRLVMMRYGIDDIRHLHSGDLRFVSQFKHY
ncbi:MAG: phenylalanine--tRNA ligase subunit alpha [Bdellovibrionales bacterium]|jgi:phenylalanyl-tRNA synthetase alpha chain|nr:phenylalanine--tRNA ligase subunit alpha [Bdellovibrionales bacterium]MBT3525913.1 phenylalanine--tRNA ligase subunit alpha [Bdellovibrionales bacterium]MBT7768055.1 phenylalanine--tRNA ligase subunit alpha [Bdellovibrionales bacterium]